MARKRRQKGSGRLLNRNGIWYLRTRRGKNEVTVSLNVRTKAEALSLIAEETDALTLKTRLARLEALQRMASLTREIIDKRMWGAHALPLGELAEMFLQSPMCPDCGKGTLSLYCGAANRLADALGKERDARTITRQDAEDYAQRLRIGITANTYNKHLNALTTVWRVLGTRMGVEDSCNPWKGIVRKRLSPHIRRALTTEEVEALLDTAQGDICKLIAIGVFTGLRMGDACRLKWEDLQGGVARVLTSKTGAKVSIPLHGRLLSILGSPEGRKGFVIPSLAERHPKDPSGISKAVIKAFAAAGIDGSTATDGKRHRTDCSFHSLRHTFVTRAIEAGVPQPVVQALVGHASAAMTERYTHISDTAILEAFRRM